MFSDIILSWYPFHERNLRDNLKITLLLAMNFPSDSKNGIQLVKPLLQKNLREVRREIALSQVGSHFVENGR